MYKILAKSCRVLAWVLAVGMLLQMAGASAAPKGATHLPVPKGGSVQFLNNGNFNVRNNLGIAGTYRCDCTGQNATGKCSTSQSEGVLTCGSHGDSCTGTCSMESTTGGGGKITIY